MIWGVFSAFPLGNMAREGCARRGLFGVFSHFSDLGATLRTSLGCFHELGLPLVESLITHVVSNSISF